MSIARYFQDELDTLRVFGNTFSKYHPKLANYLSDQSVDPDVERLLEGFALLTARLRAKIDDQLPEVTQSLLMLLWPNFLRPVPSMCILQMTPDASSLSERAVISKEGVYIDSPRVDGTSCRFAPTRDVEILPLKVLPPRHDVSREKSVVTVPLSTLADEPVGSIALGGLRFFLGGPFYSASILNMWLHRYLAALFVKAPNGDLVRLDPCCVAQGGLQSEDAVLPYPKNAFVGYRLLQEFYSVPEKFLFLDIPHVPSEHLRDEKSFELSFEFLRPLPPDVRIDARSFELHCVPAVNLFPHDAEPFTLTGKRMEYPVIPADRDGNATEIFSIDRVTGWIDGNNDQRSQARRKYTRFESFEHEIERTDGRSSLYFSEKVCECASGERFDHLISLHREDEVSLAGLGEAISVDLTCTNGQVPHQLAIGDVRIPASPLGSSVTVKNITRPTRSRYPVIDGSLQWQLISALSLNYLSLENVDALKMMLRIFDFEALSDRRREREAYLRQKGLISIRTAPLDRIFHGLPVRGMRSVIEMQESKFSSEGEMYLFATVLAEFFRLYATVNSFHELVVHGLETGEEHRWMARVGNHPLI